jgi:inner membrane protein
VKYLPTGISHAAIGIGSACALKTGKVPKRIWILSVVCAALPDIDVIGFHFGVPYEHFFGHRGFFHSLFFAMLVALFVVVVFFRKEAPFSRRWLCYFIFFFAVTGSHGVLDACTNGGLGIALFSPFDTTRYFAPWRPIQVAPISIRTFFSEWGLRVMLSEFLWLWLPLIFIAAASKFRRAASDNDKVPRNHST